MTRRGTASVKHARQMAKQLKWCEDGLAVALGIGSNPGWEALLAAVLAVKAERDRFRSRCDVNADDVRDAGIMVADMEAWLDAHYTRADGMWVMPNGDPVCAALWRVGGRMSGKIDDDADTMIAVVIRRIGIARQWEMLAEIAGGGSGV